MISLVHNRSPVHPFTKSASQYGSGLCLMSRPTRNAMIRQLQKAFRQALALNPYIVENPARVQFQFIIYATGAVPNS